MGMLKAAYEVRSTFTVGVYVDGYLGNGKWSSSDALEVYVTISPAINCDAEFAERTIPELNIDWSVYGTSRTTVWLGTSHTEAPTPDKIEVLHEAAQYLADELEAIHDGSFCERNVLP